MNLSYETVRDIIERWADEDIVTDHCGGYGEPGYTLPDGDTPLVVLGSYWCRCGTPDGLHGQDVHHPRLWQQLEDQGVEFHWYDEWIIDHANDKAYRTSPDSYSWQPSFVMDSGGEFLTPDDDVETWIDWATNDMSRVIPSVVYGVGDVLGAGFTKHNGQYENGWHPGQTDDPGRIATAIRDQHGEDVEVVFMLDSTGQFDVAFSAYYRLVDQPAHAVT